MGGPARTRSIARPQLGAGLVRGAGDAAARPPAGGHGHAAGRRAAALLPALRQPRRAQPATAAPGRTEGYCPRCGAAFSFVPKLRAGDVVGDQYEVAGCLAHGGLGWIYLARDRNVADRWVVLKGLLDSDDDEAIAAALAERLFLAEVEHPNIVKIINFVEREGAGYIVMEFVDGVSLKALLAARRAANGGVADPIPAAQAIAYVLEILPALGYLHRMGLLYCDMKPDNVIQTRDSLKLIDLGAVYRIGDTQSPVYGTVGYQAPEIEQAGPSVASDLFTVARTLAVLCIDFEGAAVDDALRAAGSHASARSCAVTTRCIGCSAGARRPIPADRFGSADEMAEQLLGVLREVVADETGTPAPARSTLFTGRSASALGRRRRPAAARAARRHRRPGRRLPRHPRRRRPGSSSSARCGGRPERTVEVDLRLAQALITARRVRCGRRAARRDRAARSVGVARALVPRRRGARPEDAEHGDASFELVYRVLPGELAPKLALGVCEELANRPAEAAAWYEIVSRTDPSYTTATFGLARCRLACGERAAALAAYARVPESSIAYDEAQTAWIACLLRGTPKHRRAARRRRRHRRARPRRRAARAADRRPAAGGARSRRRPTAAPRTRP